MTYTRIEVIDHTKSVEDGGGRVYSVRTNAYVETSEQDDGRTLKVFITPEAKLTPKERGEKGAAARWDNEM